MKKNHQQTLLKHIDRCLSCYSCMTTCPSEVNYMHLIDHGRNYIEKNYERPFWDKKIRNLLSIILPNQHLFRLAGYFLRFLKPIKFLFPKKNQQNDYFNASEFSKKKNDRKRNLPSKRTNKNC